MSNPLEPKPGDFLTLCYALPKNSQYFRENFNRVYYGELLNWLPKNCFEFKVIAELRIVKEKRKFIQIMKYLPESETIWSIPEYITSINEPLRLEDFEKHIEISLKKY